MPTCMCHLCTHALKGIKLDAPYGVQAEATEHTGTDGQVYVQVELGHGTVFTFQEDAGLGPLKTQQAMQNYEGWHCALYVYAYEGTYNKI